MPRQDQYTTRIIKGGALIEDMRLLVTAWDGRPGCADRLVDRGVLSHLSRKRALDVVLGVFVPRFVRSEPPGLWRSLAILERARWGLERIRPVHYYAAALSEPVLADVVSGVLEPAYASGVLDVDVGDVVQFFSRAKDNRFAGRRWSDDTATRVAQGVLSALRDFGVLSGAAKKRIAAQLLPIPSFAFLARARHQMGVRGVEVLRDETWRLFYLTETAVERCFVQAQQLGLLEYHAAGSVIRVDYPGGTFEEYAEALAQRAD